MAKPISLDRHSDHLFSRSTSLYKAHCYTCFEFFLCLFLDSTLRLWIQNVCYKMQSQTFNRTDAEPAFETKDSAQIKHLNKRKEMKCTQTYTHTHHTIIGECIVSVYGYLAYLLVVCEIFGVFSAGMQPEQQHQQ